MSLVVGSLNVESVFGLEVFGRVERVVLAGADRMDRPVRWVHAGEIPDIARFLSGGEMLLTAGLGMGTTPEQQRSYIRDVAAAGAAVLVVELAGRAFSRMPAPAVEEARALGFPLVGLLGEIPFVEVSAQVHEMLLETRVRQLRAEEDLSKAFETLLLRGADYITLAGELAARTACPVVLEDLAHRVLAYAGRTPAADDVVAGWAVHARLLHDGGAGHLCARRAVVLRGETWGRLHVLGATDVQHRFALERAAAAVAITLVGERASGARAAQRQTALVHRLVTGDVTGEEFVGKALGLGRDLRGQHLVAVALTTGDGPSEPGLARHLLESGLPAVVGDLGDDALAVIGLRAQDLAPVREVLTRMGVDATGGISRFVDADGLPRAVEQARSAAAVAAVQPGAGIVRFADLGATRLLAALAGSAELSGYIEDELGTLLRHDAGSANVLMPTLRAFLAADGNKSVAAKELFVQRRTLYYRLERIEKLLGIDLADGAARQALALAVQGLDLVRPSPMSPSPMSPSPMSPSPMSPSPMSTVGSTAAR